MIPYKQKPPTHFTLMVKKNIQNNEKSRIPEKFTWSSPQSVQQFSEKYRKANIWPEICSWQGRKEFGCVSKPSERIVGYMFGHRELIRHAVLKMSSLGMSIQFCDIDFLAMGYPNIPVKDQVTYLGTVINKDQKTRCKLNFYPLIMKTQMKLNSWL